MSTVAGVLIAESLRSGTVLDAVPLVVRAISRVTPEVVGPGQPTTWTLLMFEAAAAEAGRLAEMLTAALQDGSGWYVDFHADDESFVVFPGRVFRYPRGSRPGRAAAESHARSIGIPEAQIDWAW